MHSLPFRARLLPIALVAGLAACGADVQRVNTDSDGVAILGYDTVAYFTEGRPVKGSPEYEHVWQASRWRFANAEHRDLFAKDPESYAPQYGGNCAGAMARGRYARVDPEAWVIVDDKLYLNFNERYAAEFAEDASTRIPQADAHWNALDTTE